MKKFDWHHLAIKLTSRKLWVSIASFVSMLLVFFGYSETTAESVASLIMAGAVVVAYIIGEGLKDTTDAIMKYTEKETYTHEKTEQKFK